jgi:CRP-like cAMP-binding protein
MSPTTEELLFERFGRVFPAGSVLFREGETGQEMYVIQSGRVRISRLMNGRESVLAELPAGEFFGEMAIINARPRSATAMVIEDAKLLVIDAKTFEAMVRGSVEIAVRMMKKLADRLDQANAQIEMLLLRDSNHKVVHYLRRLADAAGVPSPYGVIVQTDVASLADGVGLDEAEVCQVLERLAKSHLVEGIEGGFLLPEVGRLGEFLEFLELRQRYGER